MSQSEDSSIKDQIQELQASLATTKEELNQHKQLLIDHEIKLQVVQDCDPIKIAKPFKDNSEDVFAKLRNISLKKDIFTKLGALQSDYLET